MWRITITGYPEDKILPLTHPIHQQIGKPSVKKKNVTLTLAQQEVKAYIFIIWCHKY